MNAEQKVLIIGSNGRLGSFLSKSLEATDGISVVRHTRADADARFPWEFEDFVAQVNPNWIINTTMARFSVDDCERPENNAELMAVNAIFPSRIALLARRIEAGFITFGSDYEYSGREKYDYSEDEIKDPVNEYGLSKLLGTSDAMALYPKTSVLRIASPFYVDPAVRQQSLVDTFYQRLSQGQEVKALCDSNLSPTDARDVVRVVDKLIRDGIHGVELNIVGMPTTVEGLAKLVAVAGDFDQKLVKPAFYRDYAATRRAVRPQYAALSNRKVKSTLGFELNTARGYIDFGLARKHS